MYIKCCGNSWPLDPNFPQFLQPRKTPEITHEDSDDPETACGDIQMEYPSD